VDGAGASGRSGLFWVLIKTFEGNNLSLKNREEGAGNAIISRPRVHERRISCNISAVLGEREEGEARDFRKKGKRLIESKIGFGEGR